MRQLTGLDSSFLTMETSSQYGHLASLTIFDLADWSTDRTFYEAIGATIEQRIHLIPLLRRRLLEVPLGLDHPYWIEDPDFDLEFHVRNLALPVPGSDEQLAEQVARLIARPLDRTRPLWEIYVIDGLANDGPSPRVAMLTKFHQCAIDGLHGVEMLTTLLDSEPGGREVTPTRKQWMPDRTPSPLELLARTAFSSANLPVRSVRLLQKLVGSIVSAARASELGAAVASPVTGPLAHIPGVGSLLSIPAQLARRLGGATDMLPLLPNRPAPKTPFNHAITPHRRYAFRTFPLDDAKVVRRAFGVALNDVVLAVCAGALRKYLEERDLLPNDPLVAMIPVSVTSGTDADAHSTHVSAVLSSLHTNLSDPVARLLSIHETVGGLKDMQRAVPAHLLTDITHFAPPAVAALASRIVTRARVSDRLNPPFNVVISNIPGPNVPLYCSGARLRHFFPVSTIVDGQGLSITAQSYCGSLDFGVVACRELVPDTWHLCELLEESLAELVVAARSVLDHQQGTSIGTRRAREKPKTAAVKSVAAPVGSKKTAAKKTVAKKTATRRRIGTSTRT